MCVLVIMTARATQTLVGSVWGDRTFCILVPLKNRYIEILEMLGVCVSASPWSASLAPKPALDL